MLILVQQNLYFPNQKSCNLLIKKYFPHLYFDFRMPVGIVEQIKDSLKNFNYGLFLALFIRLVIPTIYQTFRVSILGSLPNASQINIASQMSWVNVLLEIIEESILLPLYFCLGNSLNDIKETKNKVKTGILVATLVYFAFSATTSALAWPLIKIMGQNETLHEVTVDYIRIELISIVFGSLSKILMVVFVMLEWNGMLYLILIIQMVTSSGFDYALAIGADLEVMGIAYSSVCSSLIVFVFCFAITWSKLKFNFKNDLKKNYDFAWLKTWTKVGFFSGLDSFIRNAVYLVVVLRAMNLLNEQGSYWVANTFIWSWLLLPIIPLSDLIKQDVASSLHGSNQKPFWIKILPYVTFVVITLIIWSATYPGWFWFVTNVLKADEPDLVLDLICHLAPFYACFTFGTVLNGIFYGLGRTDLLALKAFLGNCLIVTLFLLFSNGILFETNVFSVATIFGIGLTFGTAMTLILFVFIARKNPMM